MRKKYVLRVYSDPGHGWVKVHRNLANDLGILGDISSCSYEKGDYVYLEEDRDMALLINAFTNKGIEFKFNEYHTNKTSRIRNFKPFVKVI